MLISQIKMLHHENRWIEMSNIQSSIDIQLKIGACMSLFK